MAGVRVDVQLKGIFFSGNPVGRFHRNVYSVLKDEAQVARDVAQSTLRSKQRTTSPGPSLSANIVVVPRRRRGNRMETLVSANYGPEPLVRFYNRFIDSGKRSGSSMRRGYRFYAAGARAAQSHIDSRRGSIEAKLVEGLT